MKKKAEKEVVIVPSRPPIVVVLGHVDHGKTTLLDYIRQTDVAAKEAGAITQHIGAYQVTVEPSKKILRQAQDDFVGETHKITFIDTPGHEAFSRMRSRGAQVADIAVLVVAANDGVMPQTIEAIRLVKEAKIPVIAALNKIDLPDINLEKIKKQLAKAGLELEEYGGKVVAIPLSGKTGKGVVDLLEMISLVAEMEQLKNDPRGPLEAVIIESKIDPHQGPQVFAIVKNGTLHQGDGIIAEEIKGKVRAMINDRGQKLSQALPGTPVAIFGLEKAAPVGAVITGSTKGADHSAASITKNPPVQESLSPETVEIKLKIILKSDAAGTLEAVTAALKDLPVQIVDSGTGDINNSDILLARSTGAITIGFNVKITSSVAKLAQTEKVKIKTYKIIYELIREIKEVTAALAHPAAEEPLGKAEILAEFPFEKSRIAGCKVIEGRLSAGDRIKILRSGDEEIGRSQIKSLRIQKEAVNKVGTGGECGVLFDPLLDFQIGDVVLSLR